MGTLMWMGVPGGGQIGAGDTKSRELCGPGGVRRVQSKCWPDTWERLDPIVFYRCGETDKQKDLNKSY